MHFRPLPVLTVVVAPMLAALIWLGAWQAGRAEWKAGEIDRFQQAVGADPLPLETALCSHKRGGLDDPLVISGKDVAAAILAAGSDRAVRMFGANPAGQPGWTHYVTVPPPACASDAGRMLVQSAFEAFQPTGGGPVDPAPPDARYLVLSWPQKPPFAAANSAATNDWHWFDAAAMAAWLGEGRLNGDIYLAQLSERLPARLSRTPPATHIGYSATWFGMAIGLIVIYALLHARAGRLRFRSQDRAKRQTGP